MNLSRVEQLANAAAKFVEVTGSIPNPNLPVSNLQLVGRMNLSRVVTSKFLTSNFRRIMSVHGSGQALEAEASRWEGNGVS